MLFDTSESVLPGSSYSLRPAGAHYLINHTYHLSNFPPPFDFYHGLTRLISRSKHVLHRKINFFKMYTRKMHAENKNVKIASFISTYSKVCYEFNLKVRQLYRIQFDSMCLFSKRTFYSIIDIFMHYYTIQQNNHTRLFSLISW